LEDEGWSCDYHINEPLVSRTVVAAAAAAAVVLQMISDVMGENAFFFWCCITEYPDPRRPLQDWLKLVF